MGIRLNFLFLMGLLSSVIYASVTAGKNHCRNKKLKRVLPSMLKRCGTSLNIGGFVIYLTHQKRTESDNFMVSWVYEGVDGWNLAHTFSCWCCIEWIRLENRFTILCCMLLQYAAHCCTMQKNAENSSNPLVLYVSCLNMKNCCNQTNISGEKRTNQDLIHAN